MPGLCAQDWIRTSTSLRTLRPEHSASTNFATWAEFRTANVNSFWILSKCIQNQHQTTSVVLKKSTFSDQHFTIMAGELLQIT